MRKYKMTKEHREKLSIAQLKNPVRYWLGKKRTMSEECKKKIGDANRKNPKLIASKTGVKFTEEHKKKISESHKGSKAYQWIEDKTKLKRYIDCEERRSPAYKHWRGEVIKRDNFKCKINTNCNGRLEVHHILGVKDHPELMYNINNGITLCHAHHPRKRAEEKRLSPYFVELVSVSKETL